jgi:pimeloyl-ACP methyl ester carboxylesterase
LNLPTLILWGEDDLVVPLYNAKTFDDLIPNSELRVFANVGHLAMEEVPDRTAEAIDGFLTNIE